MFSFEMLLYAFVILFNFSIFLNVYIYSMYRLLTSIFYLLFLICKSLWIKASAKWQKKKVSKKLPRGHQRADFFLRFSWENI